MRPPGRPPAIRGVHDFSDNVLVTPTEVVLDTSFVVHALLSAQDHHDAARRFLARLSDNGAKLYFNRLLELELMELLFRLPLIERWGKNDFRYWRHDGRAKKRAHRLMGDASDAWDDLLTAFDWAIVEVDEVMPMVRDLMVEWGLQSYDAVHVATAMALDVHAVVTADAGFANVPEGVYEMYVPEDKIKICRKFRSGRR